MNMTRFFSLFIAAGLLSSVANATPITTSIDYLVLAGQTLDSPSNTIGSSIGGDIHANKKVVISGSSVITGSVSAVDTVTVSGSSTVSGTSTNGATSVYVPTFADMVDTLDANAVAYTELFGNQTITSSMSGIFVVNGNASFSAFSGVATVIASGNVNFGGSSMLDSAFQSLPSILPYGLSIYAAGDIALQGSVSGAVIGLKNVNLATGSSVMPSVAVPEPSLTLLLMLGLAALVLKNMHGGLSRVSGSSKASNVLQAS